jgi:hypothetical protein
MNTEFSNLNEFFSRVKSIRFWQRIFGWTAMRTLSYEAYQEFIRLADAVKKNGTDLTEEKNRSRHLEEKNQLFQKSDLEKQKQLDKKDSDIKELNPHHCSVKQCCHRTYQGECRIQANGKEQARRL